MTSGINEFLDHVDRWKLKLHEKLKRMTRSSGRPSGSRFTNKRARGDYALPSLGITGTSLY